MSAPASVSIWLEDLKNGDETSGAELWNRYVEDLIVLAKHKLRGLANREFDEEDLVVSAFNAFFMGVRSKRFEKLESRDDLWQLLIMLTERKAIDQIRKSNSQRKGHGKVRGESVFQQANDLVGVRDKGLAAIQDIAPSPEFAAQFTEEIQSRMGLLQDQVLHEIVLLKMEGYSNQEIAKQIGISISSVERKLRLIRQLWGR